MGGSIPVDMPLAIDTIAFSYDIIIFDISSSQIYALELRPIR